MFNFKQKAVNNWLIAIYLTVTCVASIINSFVPIPYVSVLCALVIFILTLMNNRCIRIYNQSLIFYILFLILLIISVLLNGYAYLSNYFLFFIVFATTSLILSCIDFNIEQTISHILSIYTVYVVVYFLIIQHNSDDNEAVAQMGLAYSLVPGFCVAMSSLIFFKQSFIKKINSYLILLGSSYIILFKTITRGAIISALFGVFSLILIKISPRNRIKVLVLLSIFVILAIFSLNQVLLYIIPTEGSSIGVLNKLFLLSESGDISNGRDILYKNAIEYIKQRPLLGYGIGYYEKFNQIYPHQLFLELLCEFGIIGMVLIIFPIIRRGYLIVSKSLNEINPLIVIYLSTLFISLMVSNSFWLVPNFWFIYFYKPAMHKLSTI